MLFRSLSNIDKITFFMEECRRMGIHVLGPDINESLYDFTVNTKGDIRFGLGAVKGVGENAVQAVIEERLNGPFTGLFDLTKRVGSRAANKRCIESMVMAGAFDCFEGIHRARYFASEARDTSNVIEKAIKFAGAMSLAASSMEYSLFGDDVVETIAVPAIPDCEPWNSLERLRKEKDVIGFYVSGHPLDEYSFEIRSFCNASIDQFADLNNLKNREVSLAGILTEVNHQIGRAHV